MDRLQVFEECGITVEADCSPTSSRKTPFYYGVDNKLARSLVTSILTEYVNREESVCYPVKCIDVIGSAGTCGLLWKRHLGEKVDVKINDPRPEAKTLINKNALRNDLEVEVSTTDPCIVLHERGYNFIYLGCTNDASIYFDAAFRNIARNGVLVVTCKDDCSMHGNTPDVAMRRYGGRITRTFYYQELGIRLILAAMARTAVKYNKSLSVLCCFMHKSSFTVAVITRKGPSLANKTVENIRPIKHCMVCEERGFYPVPNGFPIDPKHVKLNCDCSANAPGNTSLELGPVWAESVFDANFVEGMLQQSLLDNNLELKTFLSLILQEAQCTRKVKFSEESKRMKLDDESHPPFYYNIHKHHPHLNQQNKINKVIESLKDSGFRASRTHFDRLAIRTDAPVVKLYEIMEHLSKCQL